VPHTTLTCRIEPIAEAVSSLLDRLEAYAEDNDLPPGAAYQLALVSEECAANVAMHGATGPGAATYVEITVAWADGQLHLTIEDDGRPFDPLAILPADTGLDVDAREIGGLGIHLIRTMVRSLAYERLDSRNRLTAVLDVTG
jgi:serine/threonine-protein kinase RsbW